MHDPRAWILELIDSEMTGTGSAQDDLDAAKVADVIADYIETLHIRIQDLESKVDVLRADAIIYK